LVFFAVLAVPSFKFHLAGVLERVRGYCQVVDSAIARIREFQDEEFIKACFA
jgi:hypothetical protein